MVSGLKSKTLNFAQHISIYFVIHLFLDNLGVRNSNQSNDVLYLVSFNQLQISNAKNAAKTTYLLLFSDK